MNPSLAVPRIVIAGPTGIGKTSVSLELVRQFRSQHLDTAIISVDSRQCYKRLDIGTGKVTPSEMDDISHYNISNLNPDQPDSAAAFVRRALIWENEIRSQHHIPMYVGGSTLHLQSLLWPLDDIPESCVYNQIKLAESEREHGQEYLVNLLTKVDPDYVLRMDGYNRARIFRALDVFMQTGKPFSSFHSEQHFNVTPQDTLLVILSAERAWHVKCIQERVDAMIENGLVDETEQLLDSGIEESFQALQTVGYKEAIEYIKGLITLDQMRERINISTRQYAKRQATWFRRWKSAITIDVTRKSTAQVATEIISLNPSFSWKHI
jgi:tRNA dimethylallyltransferase